MKLISTKELADRKGCHTSTVTKLCKKHGLGRRIGKGFVFNGTETKTLLKMIQDGPGRPKRRKW